jgi:hypothetical protein
MDSHVYESRHPDQAGWTLANQLAASAVDALRWIQWSKTKDGHDDVNMPEPIARPGVGPRLAHPKGKGLPRSKFRKLFKRDEKSDRIKRLNELFSGSP